MKTLLVIVVVIAAVWMGRRAWTRRREYDDTTVTPRWLNEERWK